MGTHRRRQSVPDRRVHGDHATQGNCEIEEDLPAGESCFLWFDNNKDVFDGSSFGFLNLCPAGEPLCSKVGWDVSGGASCPNVGASERRPWIDGNWSGGPNIVNYPAPTYVCRVSGLASNLWTNNLEGRVGDDLTFPVNDCTTQVDSNGTAVGCASDKVDKYNIIGFIVLRLDAVLDSKAEWGGQGGSCTSTPIDMKVNSPNIDLDVIAPGVGCTPYDMIANVTLSAPGNPKCCTENTHYTFDPTTNVVDWIGARAEPRHDLLGLCGGRSLRRAAEQLQRRLLASHDGRGPLRWILVCEARTSACEPSDSATCRSGAAQDN